MSVRIFWTLLFLGACIGWLVLSYRPQSLAGIEATFDPASAPLFFWLFATSVLVFILIQVILVAGVRTFSRRVARSDTILDAAEAPGDRDIRIFPAAEYFWTALPLLISLLFFWAVWQFLLK